MTSVEYGGIAVPTVPPDAYEHALGYGRGLEQITVAVWRPTDLDSPGTMAVQHREGSRPLNQGGWALNMYQGIRGIADLADMGAEPLFAAAGTQLEVKTSPENPRLTSLTLRVPPVPAFCDQANAARARLAAPHGLRFQAITPNDAYGLYTRNDLLDNLKEGSMLISTNGRAGFHDLINHAPVGQTISDEMVDALAEIAGWLMDEPDRLPDKLKRSIDERDLHSVKGDLTTVFDIISSASYFVALLRGDENQLALWCRMLPNRTKEQVAQYVANLPQKLRAIRLASPIGAAAVAA